MTEFNTYARLEPGRFERNLEQGFASAVHDPVWFLARQWQMGEHQGENASTPVWVNYDLSSRAIRAADPRFDPAMIPAEAIVESENDDWWTMGRRVRLGRLVAGLVALPDDDETLYFYHPPPPYERFHEQYDGLALWRAGLFPPDLDVGVPPDNVPAWSSRQLVYQQDEGNSFSTGAHRLTVQRHRGGRLDWHAVDATALDDAPAAEFEPREAIPAALDYPGAPNSRWWQIERAEVDPSGYVPDTAHTPTAILTELIFSHSDDWFLFPVTARAGHVVTMETLRVTDAFGRTYDSEELTAGGERVWAGLQPPKGWALFRTAGLRPEEPGLSDEGLVLWHVAEFPLEGIPIERVQFGLDEESNLLWAVERVVDGREVASRKVELPDEALHPKFKTDKPPGIGLMAREYVYIPGQGAATHWHPYVMLAEEPDGRPRRLEQRQLVDFTRERPWPLPKPEAEALKAGADGHPHFIEPLAIPSNGIEVERRWQLARDMNGRPVLWIQRQRRPLLSPPGRRLRFDVMKEALEK